MRRLPLKVGFSYTGQHERSFPTFEGGGSIRRHRQRAASRVLRCPPWDVREIPDQLAGVGN